MTLFIQGKQESVRTLPYQGAEACKTDHALNAANEEGTNSSVALGGHTIMFDHPRRQRREDDRVVYTDYTDDRNLNPNPYRDLVTRPQQPSPTRLVADNMAAAAAEN